MSSNQAREFRADIFLELLVLCANVIQYIGQLPVKAGQGDWSFSKVRLSLMDCRVSERTRLSLLIAESRLSTENSSVI